MSTIKLENIQTRTGSGTITIGASGETVQIGSGAINNLGITEADQWRLTADTNTSTNGDVTTNWERNDSSGFNYIGTGLTESSGIFTFPQTGIYLITFTANMKIANGDASAKIELQTTVDNSNFNIVSDANGGNSGGGAFTLQNTTSQFIFDVTNTTTHKIKFSTNSFATDTALRGSSGLNETHFTIIRLGDT